MCNNMSVLMDESFKSQTPQLVSGSAAFQTQASTILKSGSVHVPLLSPTVEN